MVLVLLKTSVPYVSFSVRHPSSKYEQANQLALPGERSFVCETTSVKIWRALTTSWILRRRPMTLRLQGQACES